MTPCSSWRLYVILDRAVIGSRDLVAVASAAIRGGADVLQLRDKGSSRAQLIEEGQRLLTLTRPAGIPLIINDRVDVALEIRAEGLHLGQEDLPVQDARKILGEGRLIGKSTHSLEQAMAAHAEGADYLGVGPIFTTPTKPSYQAVGVALIQAVSARVTLPSVCIGGIDQRRLGEVLQAGATCVAVVRAVCSAGDPESATRTLKQTIVQFAHTASSPRL